MQLCDCITIATINCYNKHTYHTATEITIARDISRLYEGHVLLLFPGLIWLHSRVGLVV